MELIDVPVFDSSSDDEIYAIPRMRRPKNIRARRNYFEEYDEEEFFTRFRLKKQTCTRLLGEIQDEIQPGSNKNSAIQPIIKLLLTLRFFATGSMLLVVGDFLGVSKASASKIVKEVSSAIAGLRPRYITMPAVLEEQREVQVKFYRIARFPCVVGAIDCTHVKIQSPGGNNAEHYRNRKGFFSWNVQVVCDAELRIRDIVARWPGCTHDQHILSNSFIKARFESGEMGNTILLGDSGYANTNYLLVPLANPQQREENLYNESHIRTRNVVERCFGVWKRRFPILSLGMRVCLETSKTIIVAAAVLHNIAVEERDEIPLDEIQNLENELENNIEAELPINNNNNNNIRRNSLIQNYFANM